MASPEVPTRWLEEMSTSQEVFRKTSRVLLNNGETLPASMGPIMAPAKLPASMLVNPHLMDLRTQPDAIEEKK